MMIYIEDGMTPLVVVCVMITADGSVILVPAGTLQHKPYLISLGGRADKQEVPRDLVTLTRIL